MAGENEATNLSNQVKDLSVTQSGNEETAAGDATSGEPDVAERSLLQKVIRRGLVENKNDLEIQRKDPKSPLYSVKSFEALNLKTQLLKGKRLINQYLEVLGRALNTSGLVKCKIQKLYPL